MFSGKSLAATWWLSFYISFWGAVLRKDIFPWWPPAFFFIGAIVTTAIVAGAAQHAEEERRKAREAIEKFAEIAGGFTENFHDD